MVFSYSLNCEQRCLYFLKEVSNTRTGKYLSWAQFGDQYVIVYRTDFLFRDLRSCRLPLEVS